MIHMNLLFFCSLFWPEGSGGQLATYLYSKLLAENNINVRVISGTTKQQKPIMENISRRITVLRIPSLGFDGGNKYSLAITMYKSLLSNSFREWIDWADLVYTTGCFPIIPIIKNVFHKPVVAHIHSYFPFCPVGSFHDLVQNSPCPPRKNILRCFKCVLNYEKLHNKSSITAIGSGVLNSTFGLNYDKFVEMADTILFVSNAQREISLKICPQIARKSRVITNPIPDIEYIPLEGDDFGYFGGSSPLKGYHILCKAISKLGKYRQIYVHATKMGTLSNNSVISESLIPYGWLEENAFRDLYRKIRAVLIPSVFREPFGYIVTESLLKGRIVIASRVGGIPEFINELEGVFLVKPGDPDNLAETIEEVVSMNRKEAEELGMKNRKETLQQFDNSVIIKTFIQILQDTLSRAREDGFMVCSSSKKWDSG